MLERFHVPVADRIYVDEAPMRAAAKAIFCAVGLADEDADLCADVLMFNDIRGVESHGVSNMLREYVEQYRSGVLNARPDFIIERESPTTAVIDGGGGLGLHVAPKAMDNAIEKAREFGLGSVCVHNVGHMGGTGYHAMRALPHDMIGVAMTASGSLSTLPTWGAKPMFGTNPLAWAAPAATMPAFCLDIGTSQVAQNKLRLARRVGAKVEPAWIAEMDGTPIMESVEVPDQCYLLPMGGTRENGGHKGYGFAAIVDIMCSTLTGLGPSFVARTPGFHLLAYRIDAFVDADKFKRDMDTFLQGLLDTPPAPGHDRVVYPGLIEAEETDKRRAEGIPYHSEVIDWFRSIGSELGLTFDFT